MIEDDDVLAQDEPHQDVEETESFPTLYMIMTSSKALVAVSKAFRTRCESNLAGTDLDKSIYGLCVQDNSLGHLCS